MRLVVQRVSEASVTVDGQISSRIGAGLCLFVGVGPDDDRTKAAALAEKVKHLRIFADQSGKMNLSVLDIAGAILVVSQFTLYADCRKGNRPSFTAAAPPALAEQLYEVFIQTLRDSGLSIATGKFQSDMQVALVNHGPVTLILEN
ncbi:MAG TPA: D-aminoacyl-tRNA deacylase [Candidatus Binatia bacterium]|nr:D-aminoacyl-tRNA deacylase [Candidatus Binatia bacterium]